MGENISGGGGGEPGGAGGAVAPAAVGAPFLPNIAVAPMAAPVPIDPVALNPSAPTLTTNLLQEAYARMMAPTATGTIAKRPAWAQARYDDLMRNNEVKKTGAGGSVTYAEGVLPEMGRQPNLGVRTNIIPNLGVRTNVIPDLGVKGLYDPSKYT